MRRRNLFATWKRSSEKSMLLSAVAISASLVIVVVMAEPLTLDRIQQLCPQDGDLCWQRSLDGSCFGNTLKAQVLMKKCRCACDAALHTRIQNCCRTVGLPEMKFCLPLCGYNTTVEQLGGSTGLKCVSQLTIWAYCAADTNDNIECCKAKGVSSDCLSFCKGDVPTCDLQSILSYQPCLANMANIISCHVENLQQTTRFDPEWQAPCDWE